MGKATSRLKPDKRSQSISWSFRFPSSTSIHQALGASRRRWRRNPNKNKEKPSCREDNTGGSGSSRTTTPAPATTTTSSSSSAGGGDARIGAIASDTAELEACRPAGAAARLDQAQDHRLRHQDFSGSSSGGSARDDTATPTSSDSSSVMPEESVRKLLERELRLFDLMDPRDLRSYAWYHGSTLPGGRRGAEAEIPDDGDFLVRDCTSQPGNYVLSVRHRGQALHFVINKVVHQPDTLYERCTYQFEEEGFDTVADLITFYVGSKRPISQASGARIVTPRHRKVPLSSSSVSFSFAGPPSASSSSSSLSTITRSPPHHRRKVRSQSLTPSQLQQHQHYQSPPPPQLVMPLHQLQSSTLPRMPSNNNNHNNHHHQPLSYSLSLGRQKIVADPALKFQQLQLQYQRQIQQQQQQHKQLQEEPEPHYQTPRNNSAVLLQNEDEFAYDTPPPKPPRVPRHLKPAYSYQAAKVAATSGSDSGNGSGDSEFESIGACALQPAMKGIVIRSYHQAKALGLDDLDIKQWEELERRILDATPTNYEIPSRFDLDGFNTVFLPNNMEHKPLDATALRGVTALLFETASRVLASHLTKIDVDLLLKVYEDEPAGVRNGKCGLELFILPYARQTRQDLIERTESLKLLVATTVLTCGSPAERAATISRWIQVAIDTKTALGNLFGFCSIMLGLCLPQVQSLAETWHLLRQKHTDEAFTFEAKLRPTLRAMNECADPQAPNTTIPHVLPIALLNERTHDDVLGNTPPSALVSAVLTPWENSAADGGLSIMWAHLEASRKMTENLTLFRRNAEIALEGCRNDELLGDAFRTEFHVRFLWGSRGALVAPGERHAKFVQILDVMFDRCLPTEQQPLQS